MQGGDFVNQFAPQVRERHFTGAEVAMVGKKSAAPIASASTVAEATGSVTALNMITGRRGNREWSYLSVANPFSRGISISRIQGEGINRLSV